jgi:uncharacterized protein (TIGR02391 family)
VNNFGDKKALLQLAKRVQEDAARLGLERQAPAPADLADQFDALVTIEPLRSTTRKLFIDGHYSEAVEEAYKCVNNVVKKKSGSSRDGRDLMLHVFDGGKPLLKLNSLRTESEKDEQEGYRFILTGGMVGIRNPRAHAHDLRDDPEAALEMLIWANHLLRVLERTKRARRTP